MERKGMTVVSLLLTFFLLCQGSQLSKLGIIVRYEKGNMDDLKNYLNNFIEPTCEVIQQINLILNHEALMEYHFLETQLAKYQEKIPINFYNASSSEAEFRFRMPKNSKAQIYYISNIFLNDDNCEEVRKALQLAQQKQVSGLFGLIGEKESLNSIQVDLRRKEEEIFYYDKLEGNHFCLVEDIRVIPRHILEVSQSTIKEVTMMANKMKPYCQEIFLNFVSAHFYPELRPSGATFGNSINVEIDQYTEYDQKNFCIRQFIDILGYVPVYYQRKNFTEKIWVNPNLDKVIELKRQQLIMAITVESSEAENRRLLSGPISSIPLEPFHPFYEEVILNVLWGAMVILSLGIFILMYRSHKLERRLNGSY